jgi:methylisocitrate lyase
VYPKRASYHKGLEHIAPLSEFVDRLKYAMRARSDADFLIIGRTDAFSAVEGSREELVRRGLVLRELGVDAVMPRGVRDKADLAFFRKAVPDIPLLVIAGADDISVQEYIDLGYQIIIYATTPVIVVATLRRQVEELISLPEYYAVEAETTEKGTAGSAGHH